IEEPFPEPMLLASTVELTDGLAARGVSGRGRLAEVADTARYDRKHTHCDTLVIGAGPAGLLAARTAVRAGESVVLVDDRPVAGGSLTGTERIAGRPALQFVADTVAQLAAHPDVLHLQRTTAFGHYDDGFVLALERRTDQLGASAPRHRSRQRVHRIRAEQVVVATGAHERPIVFADNDRPGIMLAASARDYLHRYGVLAGRQIVVFTSDDAAYAAATDLSDAGADVTVLDARPAPPAHWVTRCAERGVAVHPEAVVTGTSGEERITEVQVAVAGGGRWTLPTDLLLVSGGWNPTAHLFSHVRGPLAYDPALGAFRPAETLPGVTVIGAANGTLDLAGCLREGAGGDAPSTAPEPVRTPTRVLWRTEGDRARQFV
ncbi:FAD-dependent oxidoreductase, partial [Pseudonocardia lutea]